MPLSALGMTLVLFFIKLIALKIKKITPFPQVFI